MGPAEVWGRDFIHQSAKSDLGLNVRGRRWVALILAKVLEGSTFFIQKNNDILGQEHLTPIEGIAILPYYIPHARNTEL